MSFHPFLSEQSKEPLAVAKARGLRLVGYRSGSAEKALERKTKSVADSEDLCGDLESMVRSGLSHMDMAEALAGVGKLSCTGKPLAPTQIAQILQRLSLSGKFLGSDQA